MAYHFFLSLRPSAEMLVIMKANYFQLEALRFPTSIQCYA